MILNFKYENRREYKKAYIGIFSFKNSNF